MKNKTGFTLVELLGVIVLLGIIALVAIPAITNTANKQKEKVYYDQLNELIRAAQNWTTDDVEGKIATLKKSCNNSVTVTVKQLQDGNSDGNSNGNSNVSYLADNFTNPKTGANFDIIATKVTIYKQDKNYLYCVTAEECNNSKFDEYKDIASRICCNGSDFTQKLNACKA